MMEKVPNIAKDVSSVVARYQASQAAESKAPMSGTAPAMGSINPAVIGGGAKDYMEK